MDIDPCQRLQQQTSNVTQGQNQGYAPLKSVVSSVHLAASALASSTAAAAAAEQITVDDDAHGWDPSFFSPGPAGASFPPMPPADFEWLQQNFGGATAAVPALPSQQQQQHDIYTGGDASEAAPTSVSGPATVSALNPTRAPVDVSCTTELIPPPPTAVPANYAENDAYINDELHPDNLHSCSARRSILVAEEEQYDPTRSRTPSPILGATHLDLDEDTTEFGHLAFPALGPSTEEIRQFTCDPPELASFARNEDLLPEVEVRKLELRLRESLHLLDAPSVASSSSSSSAQTAEAVSSTAARSKEEIEKLVKHVRAREEQANLLQSQLSKVRLSALSALSASTMHGHRALHAERAIRARVEAEMHGVRQNAQMLAQMLLRAEQRFERLLHERKEGIIDEVTGWGGLVGYSGGSGALHQRQQQQTAAFSSLSSAQGRNKSVSSHSRAQQQAEELQQHQQETRRESICEADGVSTSAATSAKVPEQSVQDAARVALASEQQQKEQQCNAAESARSAVEGVSGGNDSLPLLVDQQQEQQSTSSPDIGRAAREDDGTAAGQTDGRRSAMLNNIDASFDMGGPNSPLPAIVKERNKLLADKRYLKARVKDAEAQLGRLEHELQMLRGFLVRSEGKRITGGGGAAVALWNAAAIADGPAGSRHRAREKARKKKVAVMGDAEAEHLLLAAKTLREKERRQAKEAAATAAAEEEEIRRAVAAAALPPLPVKPRGSRAKQQQQQQHQQQRIVADRPPKERIDMSALVSALPRNGSGIGDAGPSIPAAAAESPAGTTDVLRPPQTPELPSSAASASASLKLGSATPRTPRSAHLLACITGAVTPGSAATARRRQNISSARDDEHECIGTPGGASSSASAYASSGIDGLLQAAQLVTPGGTRVSNPPPRSMHPPHIRPEEDEYYPKGARSGFGGMALDETVLGIRGTPKRRRVASGEAELRATDDYAEGSNSLGHNNVNGSNRRLRTSTAPESLLAFSGAGSVASAGEDGACPASQLSALDLLADQAAASQHPSQNSDWSNSSAEDDEARNAMQLDVKQEVDEQQLQQQDDGSGALDGNNGQAGVQTSPARGHIKAKLKRGPEIPKEKRVPYIRWTDPEDRKLRAAIKEYGQRWELISRAVGTRSYHQCRQRYLLMRRKEAAQQGHSLANHPRLDADRVGPHYEEPQYEHYFDGEGEGDDDDDDDDDDGLELAEDEADERGARRGARGEDGEDDKCDIIDHGVKGTDVGDTTVRRAGGSGSGAPAATAALDDEEDELAFDEEQLNHLPFQSAAVPAHHRHRSLSLATALMAGAADE
ncbi:hypothetical protein K437DRAFT_256084 [Tilletiaria anomala UBC 951]|uniref:Uncharacterized protein n=1 Tax=Tilletiaria anomala (strain ATCC 24038 / CBS 436.72 / UBC 951) TaxID=1037660 RepID=A0A066W6W8_TILAU|nr:uncharacterized protein K437DRAFT_256084 [Tilletiaria anomala UBC 951]KDN46809.1 hypothetical protein K437DRAFT_256084 [Tilletiaria anomala UBC 951]